MRIDPPALYVKDTGTPKGRGAYAAKAFREGDVVEVCAAVPFDPGATDLPLAVQRMVFNWGLLTKNPGRQLALALGYGSLYNHDNPANMKYEVDEGGQTIRFVAARDIEAHDELTVNYDAPGGVSDHSEREWFERMQVTPNHSRVSSWLR